MAVSSADIGANFSDYKGDANLGGAGLGVFDIDTKPLQQLAQYTFFYNKSKWEQKQKDLEANAKEYASLTDYDLTNSIPKFSKEIQQKYNDLYSYVQANPTVMDYKNNQKGWLEYRKMKQDFETDLLNAKSQDAIYKSGQALIEKETRPDVKAFLQKQLEDQVASKDLKTPIRLQQYSAEPTVLPIVPVHKFDIIRRDAKGDMIIDREIEVADQKAINNLAGALALGLQKEVLDVNSNKFKQLPSDVQAFKTEESKLRKATGRQAVVDEAQIFTEALQHFKDPSTGKIDIDKVAASNYLIAGSLQAVIDYNKVMDDEVAKIKSGFYSDNLGVLKFGVNGLDEKDYQKIDYSDGEITATDLLKVKLRAKAPQTSYKTEAKELDLKRESLAVQWYNAKTARINANKKDEATLKASEVIDKPAMLFGEFVDTAKKYFNKNTDGTAIVIASKGVDPYIKSAVNLQDGYFLTINRDGSYITSADRGGTQDKKIGTIENLTQGVINAIKTIDRTGTDKDNKDGTMAEGFQIKSENKFKELWGTSSGKYIWDNWGAAKEPETQTKEAKLTPEQIEFKKKYGIK